MNSFLMDMKKRRSSIKRTHSTKDDDTTVNFGIRPKRRISFSGKKLVREFLGEEEAKTWKDSYEVSEHADGSLRIGRSSNVPNGSTLESKQSVLAVATVKRNARSRSLDDKENINYYNNPQVMLGNLPLNKTKLATTTLLSNSIELMDQSQLQQNSILQLDHSIDISLLEQEDGVKSVRSRASTLSELYVTPSFSLDENEAVKWPAPVERTIDFIQELHKSPQVDELLSLNMPPADRTMLQRTILGESTANEMEITAATTIYNEDMDETKCSVWPSQTKTIPNLINANTIIADETIPLEYVDNKELKQKSIYHVHEMEISFGEMTKVNRNDENHMEHNILNSIKSNITTNNCQDMYLNSAEDGTSTNHFNATKFVCSQSNELFLHAGSYKSAQCEQELRAFLPMSAEKRQEIPMDIIQSSNKAVATSLRADIFENEQQKVILFNKEVQSEANTALNNTLIISKCEEEVSGSRRRQTIVFCENDANGKMDICGTRELSKQSDPRVQLAQKLPERNTNSRTTGTGTGSKVVVVRKICTPIAHKAGAVVGGVDQHIMQRYKQKQAAQQDVAATSSEQNSTVAEAKKKNSAFDFSLANSHFTMLSPELSSPLFSPHYMTAAGKRNLNLRQLCDAIDQGKIQIFPNMPKTPLSSPKSRRAIFSSIPRAMAIKSADSEEQAVATRLFNKELEISPNGGKTAVGNVPETASYNFQHLDTTRASCKRELLYCEVDDEMLLDNTSFLAKAKLGDETASRNSSKCSTSNRRETIHFHSEIDSEALVETLHSAQVEQTEDKCLRETPALLLTAKEFSCGIALSKTVYSGGDISLEINCSDCSPAKVEFENVDTSKANTARRQTLHLCEDIPLDMDANEMWNPREQQSLQQKGVNRMEVMDYSSHETPALLETTKEFSCDTALSKTLYSGGDISLEINCSDCSAKVENENVDTSKANTARRQTLHLCEDIPLDMDDNEMWNPREQHSLQQRGVNGMEVMDYSSHETHALLETTKEFSCDTALSKTLYSGGDISLEINCSDCSPARAENKNVDTSKANTAQRQTLHLCEDIPLDMDANCFITPQVQSCDMVKCDHANFVNARSVAAESCKLRQTLHFIKDNSILAEENMPDDIKIVNFLPNTMALPSNENSQKQRQTLHFTKDNSILIEESSSVKARIEEDIIVNALPAPLEAEESLKHRQTLHFIKDKGILAEKASSHVNQNVNIWLNSNEYTNPAINITPATLNEREQELELEDSLENKLKEMRLRSNGMACSKIIDIDAHTSPMPNNNPEVRERMRKLFEGTPHRSFIEFECLERKANLEQKKLEELTAKKAKAAISGIHQSHIQTNNESSKIVLDLSGLKPLEGNDSQIQMSPVVSALNNKRLTANLTPNLPLSKKRQTLVFQNCDMDESSLFKSATRSLRKSLFAKSRIMLMSKTMVFDERSVACASATVNSESGVKPNTQRNATSNFEVSMECENKPVRANIESPSPNTTEEIGKYSHKKSPAVNAEISPSCTRTNASRIPVLIGSAKKNDLTVTRLQSPKPFDESALNQSLETIQMPRSILPLVPSSAVNQSVEEQKQQSIISVFEGNPITISDVSVYYVAQRESVKSNNSSMHPVVVEHTLNTAKSIRLLSDAEAEPELQQPEQLVLDLCDDSNMVHFNKRFINLTCNSSSIAGKLEDIDNTRLSLVETLLDDDDDDDNDNDNDNTIETDGDDVDNDDIVNKNLHDAAVEHNAASKGKQVLQTIDAVIPQAVTVSGVDTVLKNASMCRRCKCCQEVLLNETTSTAVADSFMLPTIPGIPSLGMDRLRQLRKRPTLIDVHEYYRRMSLERSFNLDNTTSSEDEDLEMEAEHEDEIDILEKKFEEHLERLEKQLVGDVLRNPLIVQKSFVQRLETLLNHRMENWVYNYQKQSSQCLLFDHKKLITFCLVVNYKEMTDMGEEIEVQSIQIRSSRVPQKNWKAIDYVMDFQLKLELPFDLDTLCAGSDEYAVFDMLHKIDQVCLHVHQLAFSLWKLVCSEQASLIRIAKRIYARKYVRTLISPEDEYARVEQSEFRIELTNLKKIYCKDIAAPALHTFSEDVQFLPVGLDFLRAFLANPTKYLK